MSEPKLISPLLDGYMIGQPISDHDGVRCCPAIHTQTNEKYIVKVISVPASQQKLDALLLAGAFSDQASALAYFKDLTSEIEEEAALLQRLSRLEGFSCHDSWQTEPMEDEVGYHVYLLSPYRTTLERFMRCNPMTHLGAVNLGLDLCAALAVCRRSGYLYVDLKPSNIVICDDREFRISDLGFIRLDSLPYASLPEKYHSAYTAPEVTDAYSALNSTLDIYAAGMILYQVYNNGVLPFVGHASEEALPAPEHADPEMAEIILKACATDPAERWQEPAQMGQALVNYMQRNSVNDTPIVPPTVPEEDAPEEEEAEPVSDEPTTEQIVSEVDQVLEAVAAESEIVTGELTVEEPVAEETVEEVAEEPAEEAIAEAAEEATEEEAEETAEEAAEETAEEAAEETAEEVVEQITVEEYTASVEEAAEEAPAQEEEAAEEAPAQEEEEPVAAEETAPADPDITPEVSQMLAQADELIAHAAPEPVVAPEPIDVPVPPLPTIGAEEVPEEPQPEAIAEELVPAEEVPAEETAEPATEDEDVSAPEETLPEEAEQPQAEETATPEEEPEEVPEEEDAPAPKRGSRLLVGLICLLLTVLLALGGFVFYKLVYQQTINGISLQGTEDRLVVTLDTEIRDELLSVVCSDPYGNTLRVPVVNGVANFEGLKPDTRYKVNVEISGFHQLIGLTSGIHVTAEQTTISHFTAVTGSEDGSVILNFTVQGPESDRWQISYSATGEERKTVTFTGHMTTITGLTVGKEYTFRLQPVEALYMVGEDTLTFKASAILYAEELTILGFTDNALTATWLTPADSIVNSWIVRCYNNVGYDYTITVTDSKGVFENLDPTQAYTVEVKAAGMSLATRAYVSANSITLKDFAADISDPTKLELSWDFIGNAPEGGWLVLYTLVGMEEPRMVQCEESSAVIEPLIPGGIYTITIQTANGTTVFNGKYEVEVPKAKTFSGYDTAAEHITFQMCITPTKTNWTKSDLRSTDYTTEFTAEQSASFAVTLNSGYNTSSDQVVTLYLIRDKEGNLVSNETDTRPWASMWHMGFGRFTIPVMPEVAGEYNVAVYFNGQFVTSQDFSIT